MLLKEENVERIQRNEENQEETVKSCCLTAERSIERTERGKHDLFV